MHIYHYAAYEKSALRRLMSRHGTREEEVDHLLRNEVLVDLYRVVRQGIRLSTDSYSLKKVERLYMPAREESIADAAGSMVMYERWLTSREDGGDGDASLLEEIALYNERDCASTLRSCATGSRRVASEEEKLRGAPIERPSVRRARRLPSDSAHRKDRRDPGGRRGARRRTSRRILRTCRPDARKRATWLLAPLLSYHRRENKVNWWRHYDQLAMSPEELERDTHALGPLEIDPDRARGRSPHHRALPVRAPGAPRSASEGDKPLDPESRTDARWAPVAGEVTELDSARGAITLSRTPGQAERGAVRFLIPTTPFATDAQEAALLDLGRWVAANGADAPGANRAGRDLLLRLPPRLAGGADCVLAEPR